MTEDSIGRWAAHWERVGFPPPTDDDARFLRQTFGTIKGK